MTRYQMASAMPTWPSVSPAPRPLSHCARRALDLLRVREVQRWPPPPRGAKLWPPSQSVYKRQRLHLGPHPRAPSRPPSSKAGSTNRPRAMSAGGPRGEPCRADGPPQQPQRRQSPLFRMAPQQSQPPRLRRIGEQSCTLGGLGRPTAASDPRAAWRGAARGRGGHRARPQPTLRGDQHPRPRHEAGRHRDVWGSKSWCQQSHRLRHLWS
mmetsp:Transcript_38956/g.97906  ORF Transcript_38956/g.97906 Transcript_38956/m.97906 type:complete len:210 (-) Transcript_38956:96-725(-)